jgi:ABC-type hemin transport system ATPase subunit
MTPGTTQFVTIRITGKHGSVSDLLWENVPPFALLTGLNGAGKTQLLEVLAGRFRASKNRPAPRMIDPSQLPYRAEIDGCDFKPGEVFHSYGDWPQLPEGGVTEDQIGESIRMLRSNVSSSKARWWESRLADESGLSIEKIRSLRDDEFYCLLTPGMLWGHDAPASLPTLSFLFLAYALLERDARKRGERPEEIRRRFGEPPWDLLNEILSVSGLPYEVNRPSPDNLLRTTVRKPSFSLQLWDIERKAEVPLSGLSSGEKVIMSTVLWRYSAEHVGRHYRLLLLDEPDAHLHPSLTRQFFDVVQQVFVSRRGVRVIASTHSPSTVALAPADSIFEMRRYSAEPTGRIQPIDRDRAVSLLTAGLLVVTERTRFVFVEGKDDSPFYQMIWDLCTHPAEGASGPLLNPSPSLIFQPVGSEGKQGPENTGIEQVRRIVGELRKYQLPNPVTGIIDRDEANLSSDGVFVPRERRAIEHFLYDPLVVWTALRLSVNGEAPPIPGLGIAEAQEYRLRALTASELQRIADAVLAGVQEKIGPAEEEKACRMVRFNNGHQVVELQYPAWQLDRPKTDIRNAYHSTFRILNVKRLLYAYRFVHLIPDDLVSMLRQIQSEGE